MAALYVTAGLLHLIWPDAVLPIVPSWVPDLRDVILITGVCELVGATALLSQRWRWSAGGMLAACAICVFPANVKHAVEGIDFGLPTSWWYHGPRLALQPILVWWALYCGDVIDWPFRRQSNPSPAA
jgi:uncharacterized membrane protein